MARPRRRGRAVCAALSLTAAASNGGLLAVAEGVQQSAASPRVPRWAERTTAAAEAAASRSRRAAREAAVAFRRAACAVGVGEASIRGSALALGGLACGASAPAVWRSAAGLVRGLRFWRRVLPIYAEYRLNMPIVTQRLAQGTLTEEEAKTYWHGLHVKHAPSFLRLALDLRGFYVKLGQVASTRRDMFPEPWVDELEQLQGEHPGLLARPVEDIWRIIQRDLRDKASLIEGIVAEPLGAAATGQVHRARLVDGRDVVVKVQYPEAQQLYRQDFANTKLFCALLQREHLSYLKELEQQFSTEFDYRLESRDLADVTRELAAAAPFAKLVRVPEPVLELSSKNVVVMEYFPGRTLLSYAKQRKRELERSSIFWAYWRGWLLRRELRRHFSLLIDVQGYQILISGIFNGDPHPGNIMLLPDGRLGLIDYGNVNRLTLPERARLGRLILALAADDRGAVVAGAEALGFRTRRRDPEALYRYARLAFDRDDGESMRMPDGSRPANVQVYLERLGNMDPLLDPPKGFVMASRNSFLIRGLGTHLGVAVHMARCWKHFAEIAVARDGRGGAHGDGTDQRRLGLGMRGPC